MDGIGIKEYITKLAGEEMLPSYFSAFPVSREVNPASWDAKLKFWREVLQISFQSNEIMGAELTFNAERLAQKFMIDGLAPRGISHVLFDMHQSKDIVSVQDFKNESNSYPMIDYILGTIRWGVSWLKLWEEPQGPEIKEGTYIAMVRLERFLEKIEKFIASSTNFTDLILSPEELFEKIELSDLSELGREILLEYSAKKGLLIHDKAKNIVRLHRKRINERISITPLDREIYVLKSSERTVRLHISELDNRVEKAIQEARAHLSQQRKSAALHCIKLKKNLEVIRDKKLQSLGTLESLILQIDQCHSDQEVLQAFKLGTSTLKSMLATPGYTAEEVEKTMEDLQDVLQDHEEIDRALAVDLSEPIDEDALEAELNELLALELPAQLPAVPFRPMAAPLEKKDEENFPASVSVLASSSAVTKELPTPILE